MGAIVTNRKWPWIAYVLSTVTCASKLPVVVHPALSQLYKATGLASTLPVIGSAYQPRPLTVTGFKTVRRFPKSQLPLVKLCEADVKSHACWAFAGVTKLNETAAKAAIDMVRMIDPPLCV